MMMLLKEVVRSDQHLHPLTTDGPFLLLDATLCSQGIDEVILRFVPRWLSC